MDEPTIDAQAELERLTGCRYLSEIPAVGEWKSVDEIRALTAVGDADRLAPLLIAVARAAFVRGHAAGARGEPLAP